MPVLLTNRPLTDLETGGQTSTVGEPSIAKKGNEILLTGNWYATRSSDGGATWRLVNPFNFFPAADGGFCCDQTALHDPVRGLTFWLLQYGKQNGTNTLRLAVNKTANLADGSWLRWDFKPQQVNPAWAGEWFDYNHAALSDNFLYVATNVFRAADDVFTRAVVLRFPLATIASGGALPNTYFQTSTNFSLRCTQGARGVMYFAGHNNLQQIRLHAWPDNANQITNFNINVAPWSAGQYSAPCTDGSDWIRRCDSRITAGWASPGEIGFMWTVNRRQDRPFPYVRVLRLREAATPTVLSERDLWHQSYAYAYPDTSTNSGGEVGVSLFRGGGAQMPGHVVGVLNRATDQWQLSATRDGTRGPADNKWGDYVGCRRDSTNPAHWVACGFTLQGGATRDFIEPRYVRFSV